MNISSLDKRDNERLQRGGERTFEGQTEVDIKHNQTITPTPQNDWSVRGRGWFVEHRCIKKNFTMFQNGSPFIPMKDAHWTRTQKNIFTLPHF